MLKNKLERFYAAVDDARQAVGDSPARIADAILSECFPGSYGAAMAEGCDDMLRVGAIKAITRYITKPSHDERQLHMNDIDPDVLPYVEKLGKTAYLVPSDAGQERDEDTKTLGFYVPIADLISDLNALRAARDFLSMKAGHVQAEADKLSRLIHHLETRS